MAELETAHLRLPYLAPAQAQKHVTHNEALRRLDGLVQLAVEAAGADTPPTTPAEGARYLVGAAPTGDWTGQGGRVAHFVDGGWLFAAPEDGWIAFDRATERLLVRIDGAWQDLGSALVGAVPQLGVNTAADATNRLAVRSNAVLFAPIDVAAGGSGDVRFVVDKEAAANTASLLFQSGWSGRAEMGLPGGDDFALKVSPDGALWKTALTVDRTSGVVSFPSGFVAPPRRELLTGNRTYYVRADGSDGNDGLADSAGGAFLTIQKAVNAVAALDLSTFNVTIQLADGTWSAGATVSAPWIGSGTVTLRGNPTTPANCVISTSEPIRVQNPGARLIVSGLRLVSGSGSGIALTAQDGGQVTVGAGIVFGACTNGHMRANGLGSAIILQSAAYTIDGAAPRHFWASPLGYVNAFGASITFSGTLAFSTAFASADRLGTINAASMTLAGTATSVTGKRYDAQSNAVINTSGGGAGYFPGSVAGTTASGGQYL